MTAQFEHRARPVSVPAGGAAVGSGKPDRRPPDTLHPADQDDRAERNLSISAPKSLHPSVGGGAGVRPANRTITLLGARGGQGTTTVAAAIALFAAAHENTVLMSTEPTPAAAVLGVPAPDGPAPVEVSATLLLAAHDSRQVFAAAGVVITDAGRVTPDAAGRSEDGERYLVLRGPCYVALAAALAMGVTCDGVILVAEAGRSLGADDVTDVLGVPVVATVTASPAVARAIDAGLLAARLDRLADLRPLRHLVPRQNLSNRPLMTHTALLLSPAIAAETHIGCRDRPSQVTVWGVCSAAGGPSRVEHRTTQPRRGRLLPGRGRLLGRGLLHRPR